MSTSLSRQLEQLRTSSQGASQLSKDGGASVASLGPCLLDVQLGGEQLTLLAKEAIQELSLTCPIIGSFAKCLFRDDPDDVMPDDADEDMSADKYNVEDLLHLLTPFVLKRPAQYVLQYLVSKHKVHLKNAEALFFATLPYYDYAIFNRIVESLPLRFGKAHAEEDYPRWVENFKHACHPATSIGLARHLASDQGFFKMMCHIFVHKLLRGHVERFQFEDGVSYDKAVHFFIATMIKALNLCGNIGEHQTYNLMQVILAGLKNGGHKEFKSAAIILFAALVPRVSLKKKVANKLVKTIGKVAVKDVESLSLTALLFRCQISEVDTEMILSEFISHEEVIFNVVFSNVAKQVDEDQEFARRILKALALLCSKVLDIMPTPATTHLLIMVQKCVSEWLPTNETAEILISCISKSLLLYKGQKKGTEENEADALCRKRSISACKRILETLKKSFIEEYSAKSVIRHDSDILFIEGIEDPSAELIAAKRIMLDNEIVRELMGGQIVKSDFSPEVLKSSYQSVKTMLATPIDFLISQQSNKDVVVFCINVARAYAFKPKVVHMAIQLLMAPELTSREDVFSKHAIKLDLLILPLFFNNSEKSTDSLKSIVEKCSALEVSGLIALLKPTLEIAQSDDSSKVAKRIFEKFMSAITAEKLCRLTDCILASEVHNTADLCTLFILALAQALKGAKSKEVLCCSLVKLLFAVSTHFNIRSPKDTKKSEDAADLYKHVLMARQTGFISSLDLIESVKVLLGAVSEDQKMMLCVLSAIWQTRSIDPSVVDSLNEGLEKLDGYSEYASALLSRPIENALNTFGQKSDEGSLLKHVHLQAACGLRKTFEQKADVVKNAMSFGSPIIPNLLGGLYSDSKKVRKKVIACFEVALQKPVARANYAALVKAFVANKVALIATSENVSEVIKVFMEETRSGQNSLEAILNACLDSDDLLGKLAPMLTFLDSKGIVQLALHSTALLASLHEVKSKLTALEALVNHVGPALLIHLAETPVYEFFQHGIKSSSNTILVHNGLPKTPACAIIDSICEYAAHNDVEKKGDLFRILIDLSKDELVTPECLTSARGLLLVLLPGLESAMVIKALREIWGEDFFSTKGTKKRPVSSTANEVEKWQKTTFFLEVCRDKIASSPDSIHPLAMLLKRALHEQDQHDHIYILDLLISTLLATVSNFTQEEKETNTLDPELVVQCIRNCTNADTKAAALMLLAKSTASNNAEYILHNSIQLFTFVGTHFLQVESKSSFDIACTAIDILVPHILDACKAKGGPRKVAEMTINILNTFVDASSDIPRHRFCLFMHQLAVKLGARDYLWLLTLLLIKADPRKKHYDSFGAHKSSKLTMEEKQQQLRDLYAMFDNDTPVQVHSLVMMIEKTSKNTKEIRNMLGIVAAPGAKLSVSDQFDLIRVKMLSFAHSLLSSRPFMHQIIRDLQEDHAVEEKLQNLLEGIILTIEEFHKQHEVDEENEMVVDDHNDASSKIRRHLSLCCEKVFEATLAIIPTPVFVKLLARLLDLKQHVSMQRKALEVLNARLMLQETGGSDLIDDPGLDAFVTALSSMALSSPHEQNRQLAFMCIRSLAKAIQCHPKNLVAPLKELCGKLVGKHFLNSLSHGPLIAAALLCITELFTCLGAHAVVYVKPFIVWVLELMNSNDARVLSSVVLNSLVVSVQKAIDNFGGFLNPHYKKLVVAACKLSAWHSNQEKNSEAIEFRHGAHRIKQLQLAMSKGIPTHALLSIIRPCYDEVRSDAMSVIALANIIKENVSGLERSEVLTSSSAFLDFFMHSFKHRQTEEDMQIAHEVEEALGEAFLGFALKLSLDDFKPLYYRLFNLALDAKNLEGVTTVFHITTLVAGKLRSLFSFVYEMIVQKATTVLQESAKAQGEDEARQCNMLGYVLDALASIFMFNRVDSLLMKSYEDHVNAILEHMDGRHVDDEFLEKMKNCLGQLALTTEDETQWKYLNYQVLMLIRNRSPKIRLTILDIVETFVEKRGENYLAVLPDSVHFLVEALEDDEQQVENRCRALIKKMEEVFGQSIESYFE